MEARRREVLVVVVRVRVVWVEAWERIVGLVGSRTVVLEVVRRGETGESPGFVCDEGKGRGERETRQIRSTNEKRDASTKNGSKRTKDGE